MGNNVQTRSDKTSVHAVRFRWGSPTQQLLLTDGGEDRYLAFSSDPFLADAALELELGTRTGGLGEGTTKIRISRDISIFADQISSGRAFPKVTVEIWELVDGFDPEIFQQKTNRVFRGKLVRAIRNPAGFPGIVELEAQASKNSLDFAAGIQCNAECGNIHGKGGCTIDVASLGEAATVNSLNRNIVTITGLSAQSDGRYWRRGYVSRNGLDIQIREWDGDVTFDLAEIPPVEWEDAIALGGASCTVYPGCDLLYSTCLDVWNNTDQFNGIGAATPDYNPIFENPDR